MLPPDAFQVILAPFSANDKQAAPLVHYFVPNLRHAGEHSDEPA
jgi:hypothetical protein